MSFFITNGVGHQPLRKPDNSQMILTKYGYARKPLPERKNNEIALKLAKESADRKRREIEDQYGILGFYSASPVSSRSADEEKILDIVKKRTGRKEINE